MTIHKNQNKERNKDSANITNVDGFEKVCHTMCFDMMLDDESMGRPW